MIGLIAPALDDFLAFGLGGPAGNSDPEPFDVCLYDYLSRTLPVPVYPGHIPQSATLPAVSYFAVSEDPYYLLAGPSAGMTSVIYQVDCWSTDYRECVDLERSLRTALHGFRGMMGSTRVFTSRLRNRTGLYEANVDGSDDGTYHLALEYLFLYRERPPAFPAFP